jgi:hypothetical protein
MTAKGSGAHHATGVYLLRFPRGVGDAVVGLTLPESVDLSGLGSAMVK